MLYWKVGERIRREILQEKRAEYGQEIVPILLAQLVQDYGRSFEVKNLWRMMQFAEYFLNEEIVVTLSRQLSWSPACGSGSLLLKFVKVLGKENVRQGFFGQDGGRRYP